jgi:hypothetical protein
MAVKDPFDPNNIVDKLSGLTNVVEGQLLNMQERHDFKVSIRPDREVSPGMFKADPQLAGGYIAHPVTIRAMKKDIFMPGEGFEDLEMLHNCHSCKRQIDLQFWNFCPLCEAEFNLKQLA